MKVLLGIRSFSPPKDVCGQLIRQARERLSTASRRRVSIQLNLNWLGTDVGWRTFRWGL